MKKAYLLFLLLIFPLFIFSQTTDYTTKGFRAGINIIPTYFGEYGITLERYSGNHSIYLSLAYMITVQRDNIHSFSVDYVFNRNTLLFFPSRGPVARLGYKFVFGPKKVFYLMPEFIFKQSSFDHITFYKLSDDFPIEETYSLCGHRYGAAVKMGWQNYFGQESKIYWELNLGLGVLYYNDHYMLYSSKFYPDDPRINQLLTNEGWGPTYSINFIIGFDFSK